MEEPLKSDFFRQQRFFFEANRFTFRMHGLGKWRLCVLLLLPCIGFGQSFSSGVMTSGEAILKARNLQELSLSSAESALESGFPSVAARILSELLVEKERLDPELSVVAEGQLLLALLNQGKLDEAASLLRRVQDPPSDRLRLGRVLYYLESQSDLDWVQDDLAALEGKDLGTLQSWLLYARGTYVARRSGLSTARNLLDQAVQLAVNNQQRAHLERLVWREEILSGERSETLAISLKAQIQNAVNPLVTSQLVQQYAVVLAGLGREAEAIREIENQIALIGEDYREQRDRLLLTLVVVAESQPGKRQVALEQILANGINPRIRAMAFHAWLSQLSLEQSGDLPLLHQILRNRADDPLRSEITYVLALNAFYRGDRVASENWVRRILEGGASESMQASALRVLVGLCWTDQPPKYRLAAEHLLRLRNLTPDSVERDRLSVLVGDSYYLNGDYENALIYYNPALELSLPRTMLEELTYKVVDSYLRTENLEAARPILDRSLRVETSLSPILWASEWNYCLALVRSGQGAMAMDRLEGLRARIQLQALGSDLMPDALLRVGWMMGFVQFQHGNHEETVELCQGALAQGATLAPDILEQPVILLLHDELRTLEARSRLAMGEEAAALALFTEVRERGSAESAAATYMFEARHFWAQGNVTAAQLALVRLADLYPNSEYAPVALYEAALNLESRGTEASDQEAVRLYHRIAREFPSHALHFLARLRQGDLLRKSNQFALAVPFYENLLQEFAGDQRLYLVEVALGESYLALGSTRSQHVEDAARIFERIFDQQRLPWEVRIEAATKAAVGLTRANRVFRAQELLWRVIDQTAAEPVYAAELGGSGRYWLARAVLMLAELMHEESRWNELQRLSDFARSFGLPGVNLIRIRP
jgi:cellulose synthase operon protein C